MTQDEAEQAAKRWNRLFPVGSAVRVDGYTVARTIAPARPNTSANDVWASGGDLDWIVLVRVEPGGEVSLKRVAPVRLP